MKEKSTISFKEVQTVMNNGLDELVRQAAQKMIATAINIELSDFMKRYSSLTTEDGQQAVVKNG